METSKDKIKKRLQEATIRIPKGQEDMIDQLMPKLGEKDVVTFEEGELDEKAVSRNQQEFMGMVYQCKKTGKCASEEVRKAAEGMSEKEAKDFASTKHKGLPEKVKEEDDWVQMLRMAAPMNEEGMEGGAEAQAGGQQQDPKKLKMAVEKIMNKLAASQFGNLLKQVDTKDERVEMVTQFAKLVNLQAGELPLVVKQLKLGESVRPKMKKGDLEKFLTENKKK